MIQQLYDPPRAPSDNFTHSTPQASPQQGSSSTFQSQNQTLTRSQFQITTSPQQSTQSIQYPPAQSSIPQNPNPVLTINTLHTNPITNPTTSRTLARPPLPLIQNNPLSYNLTSTNFHPQPPSNTTQNTTSIQSSSTQYRRVERTVWNHSDMPLPVTLDPLECKNLIRHLNGSDNEILNNFNYNRTFTLLEIHYFQEQLERFQTPFTVYQFNKMYTGTFTYMSADKNWIYDPLRNPFHNCPAHHQFEVNLVSSRLAIPEVELTYDDTQNGMLIDGHTLPCYFADGFCKPTTKTPYTLVWFSDDFCFIFTLKDFIGRMTKIDDRYWIETDSFVHSSTPEKSTTDNGIRGTSYPYIHAPRAQNTHNPNLSRFEIFPSAQFFGGKPDPLYSTQYSDLFVTYTEGFNLHAGQPNPSSVLYEHISGKIVLNNSNNKFMFPALNVPNIFATIDYDAHINTIIDNTNNHIFRSMTVQELNALHAVCELERNQLLTILAMSVQNPQHAGFLLTGNRSNFLYVEGSPAWLYDCPHFLSPLYITDRCFDRIPTHFKDTLLYVDYITRQIFDYATPITCENNPKNTIELDPDSDDQDFYILEPEPIKRKPPLKFTPAQNKTTIRPNSFTAQDAGIYSMPN